ncbi:capsular polysaccharide transport system permease protein [Sphingomonas trueperi]|uniref:lipopolysaccharide biosynthesis protein n=1 Tax=Sphingomonas trueperi TaxID=53317 RepID=UPI00339587A0
MNMHGIFAPVIDETPHHAPTLASKVLGWLRRRRAIMLVVFLPTALVAGYYYLIAADQYVSEAHFIIRSSDTPAAMPSSFGSLLGLAGGMTQSQGEALSVSDYLVSHEAVATLDRDIGLIGRFQRPEADAFSRLRSDQLTPERLLKYYKGKVAVNFNRDTGITTLSVHAFRPDDAYAIIQRLMTLGEQRVNQLNARGYNDAVGLARRQLSEAETALAKIQEQMTSFRQRRQDIDPEGSGKAQIGLVSTLRGQLAAAQSQLDTMGAFISRSSPQYIAMSRQVQSLRSQVAAQAGRLTGDAPADPSIATDLGGYEDLRLRQEFVGKRYEAAAANFEQARERAQRQQLYLVRVVDANKAVTPLYPERGRIVLTVFLALLLIYGIGWLIVAGVREHAA